MDWLVFFALGLVAGVAVSHIARHLFSRRKSRVLKFVDDEMSGS
jgi:hypothetical protein